MGHDLGMNSRVHPKYKTKYRVKNWASYDRALARRGDVTVWLSPEAIATSKPRGREAGSRLLFGAVAARIVARDRNRMILRVKEIGRRRWKQESQHHRQSRVEKVFFRYKAIIWRPAPCSSSEVAGD